MRTTLLSLLLSLLLISSAAADNHLTPQPLPAEQFNTLIAPAGPISLGSESYRGVLARAELSPLPGPDVGSSGDKRYLLSVSFDNEKNNVRFRQGDVAVKITTPDGKVSAPTRLNPEEGLFQVEIELPAAGESLLRVGSKLPDEKKRIYRFFHTAR